MALPRPQPVQDWLSQCWNIAFGRRWKEPQDDWLAGPFGEPGGIHERVIEQIARNENLVIDRNQRDAGLVEDFSAFPHVAGRIHPAIADFYSRTPLFQFEVWSRWTPGFGFFGRLVGRTFSRRIGQLNLPEDALDTAYGISSEVILLRESSGIIRHRIWLRRLKKTNAVIYCGVYTHAQLPSGETCLKVIFPLPMGNATVVMRLAAGPDGGLDLRSHGRTYGDPGFYLLVEDCRGFRWKHYIRSFHERIRVFVDAEGVLRADHEMSVWGVRAFCLHYKITRTHPPPVDPVAALHPQSPDTAPSRNP